METTQVPAEETAVTELRQEWALLLRRLLDTTGLSQKQLAKHIGYPPHDFSRYLNLRRLPPVGFLTEFCGHVEGVSGRPVPTETRERADRAFLRFVEVEHPHRYEIEVLRRERDAAIECVDALSDLLEGARRDLENCRQRYEQVEEGVELLTEELRQVRGERDAAQQRCVELRGLLRDSGRSTSRETSTVPYTDMEDWRLPGQTVAQKDELAGEVIKEVTNLISQGDVEPRHTIALACVGAETAKLLAHTLTHEWALYTPQQAAGVASAAFAQLTATCEALRQLGGALDHMAGRRDIHLATPPSPGQPEGLSDAVVRLHTAAETALSAVDSHASFVVATFEHAPISRTLPTDTHAVLAEVGELLNGSLSFHGSHSREGSGAALTYPDPCSCVLTF
ncbi:helix-turn-helix domain-containing protein [Streptomyces sp. NPDC005374]|uniref:helix-turn-helix domain-containing protein n=1 Tax=Streptomyces sp. NPDC005374 TaxID=3364713 RepID=UPI0036BEFB0F